MRRTGPRPRNTSTPASERGEVSTEAVLVMPIVILLMFAVVQTGVAWFARNALDAAAEDALRAAQAQPASALAEVADTTARTSVSSNAGFIKDVAVTVGPASRADRIVVRVSGEVGGAFPGMRWHITGTASGPLERFRPQGEPT